jgi:hypothetical protein
MLPGSKEFPMSRSRPTSARHRFIPQVEALEDRRVPTILPVPIHLPLMHMPVHIPLSRVPVNPIVPVHFHLSPAVSGLVQHGATLFISPGFSHGNLVATITDIGNGNVTVTLPGASGSFHHITDIEVRGGGIRDRVTYNLLGKLLGSETVNVKQVGGSGAFTAMLGAAVAGALSINAVGSSLGNNTLTANLSGVGAPEPHTEVLPGATLRLFLLSGGGAGNDSININSVADVDAGGTLDIYTQGPTGFRKVRVSPIGVIHLRPGRLAEVVTFDANIGQNTGLQQVAGHLVFNAIGGNGANNISGGFLGPVQGGTMIGFVQGGPQDDFLRLAISPGNNNDSPGTVAASINGFPGLVDTDTAVHTHNVLVFNCQIDIPI